MARITNRAKICLDQSMESTITKKNSGVKLDKQLSCPIPGEKYYSNATGVKRRVGKQLSGPIRRNQHEETTRGKRMDGKKSCTPIPRNQYESTRGKRVDGKQISSPITRTQTFMNKSGEERKDIKLASCPTPGIKNYQNTSGRKKMGERQSSSSLPRNWYHKNASDGKWNTNGRKEEHVPSRLIPETEVLFSNSCWDDGSSESCYSSSNSESKGMEFASVSSSNSESKGMEFASVETTIPKIETADNKELTTLALEQDRGLEPTAGTYDKFAHLLYFRPIYSDLHLLKPKLEPVTEDESMKDTIAPEIECKVTEDESMKYTITPEIECKVTEDESMKYTITPEIECIKSEEKRKNEKRKSNNELQEVKESEYPFGSHPFIIDDLMKFAPGLLGRYWEYPIPSRVLRMHIFRMEEESARAALQEKGGACPKVDIV